MLKEVDTIIKALKDLRGAVYKNEFQLLLLTAVTESGYRNLWGKIKFRRRQIRGPARGIFQMEPSTAQDIIYNYLNYRKPLLNIVRGLMGNITIHYFLKHTGEVLEESDYIATIFARLHYLRVPEPIPDNLNDAAVYYKKFYNTFLGKATVEKVLSKWKSFKCDEIMDYAMQYGLRNSYAG
ncbi:MAG: hypothetical protein QXS29_09730 [Nitrososphaeria archaeon]